MDDRRGDTARTPSVGNGRGGEGTVSVEPATDAVDDPDALSAGSLGMTREQQLRALGLCFTRSLLEGDRETADAVFDVAMRIIFGIASVDAPRRGRSR
jgi:hypothetical protein